MITKKSNNLTNLLFGLLLIMISFSLGYFGFSVYYGLKTQIQKNKEIVQSELDFRFYSIEQKINNLQQILIEKIANLPDVMRCKKIQLEQTLKQINVVIVNKTIDALGSGVTIKYKENYYILSAGHIVENDTDTIIFMENEQEIGELEIVKRDYTFDEKNTIGNDLTLFRPKNKNLKPNFYTELSDTELLTGSEIYIVGNPMGIEDVVSDGRIIMYQDNFFYYIDHTYFGNSGGGVYTREGKLLGIVSHLIPIQPYLSVPPYMIHGAVKLSIIQNFLEDVKNWKKIKD